MHWAMNQSVAVLHKIGRSEWIVLGGMVAGHPPILFPFHVKESPRIIPGPPPIIPIGDVLAHGYGIVRGGGGGGVMACVASQVAIPQAPPPRPNKRSPLLSTWNLSTGTCASPTSSHSPDPLPSDIILD